MDAAIIARFLDAAEKGDTLAFSRALSDGSASIDAANESGETALAIAVQNGHAPIVAMALAAEADPNAHAEHLSPCTPLWYAVRNGDVAIVKTLLDAGAHMDCGTDKSDTAVACAIQHNHVDVVVLLLAATQALVRARLSVNVSGYDVLSQAVREGASNAVVTALLVSLAHGRQDTTWGIAYTLKGAVQANHVPLVQKLVAEVVDMNRIGWHEFEPLVYASENGYVEIVQLLVQAGADVNAQYGSREAALPVACRRGHLAVIDVLLTALGVMVHGNEALLVACQSCRPEVVQTLHAAGASVHHVGRQGKTALMLALRCGHLDTVELLLGLGVAVDRTDRDGNTALFYTSGRHKGCGVTETLLATARANVNHTNVAGESPLFCAARSKDVRDLDILLAHGADVDCARGDGTTPLMIACSSGSGLESAACLLAAGANVNGSDHDGYSALLRAAADGAVAIVELLLMYGADVNHVNYEGYSALTLARARGHSEVVDRLRRHGGS